MKISMKISVLALCICFEGIFVIVNAFSTGPPPNICLAPYPHHSRSGVTIQPQSNGNAPYSISLNPNTYGSGTLITITITSTTVKSFKGLLLTFKPNTTEMTLPVGQFLSCQQDGFKFHSIQGTTNSCLVHSNGNIKPKSITCIYKSPTLNYGPLIMSALIVQDYSTFWIRLEQTVQYIGTDQQQQSVNNPTTIISSDVSDIGCGSTKSCLLFPNLCASLGNCEYMVSYKKSGDNVDFEIVGPGLGYLALGFSFDAVMKDDLVIGCSMDPSTGSPKIQTGSTRVAGSSKILDYSVDDNVVNRRTGHISTLNKKLAMTCSFSIPKTLKYSTNVLFPMNLSQPLFIFLANGDLYPNTSFIKKHVESPLILIATATLYSDTVLPNKYFTGLFYPRQVHGTLMTIAFIILLPMAVMIARHFRHDFKVQVYGKGLWFHLHIVCNILFFVFAFAGYFYIISQLDNNWNRASQIHGGVGTVVMILAVINIIMGFARPDIGTPNRIYFYWAHFLNGTMIRLLAFITFWLVFFTVVLRNAFKNWMMIVVVIWTGVEITISVVFGIMRKVKGSKQNDKAYDINGEKTPEAFVDHVGVLGMVLYILFIFSLALALLFGLWLN